MEQNVCLVILSILVVYLLFKDLQRNESFVNESFMNDSFVNESFENITLGSADDQNAINKLAQIATQLMAGAVTVPGAISLSNNKTKFSLVNDGDDVFRLKDNGGGQLLAINHQGGIWSKDNSLILSGGNLALTGGLTSNGPISSGVNAWNTSRDGINRTYYENNGRTFYGSANGIHTWRTGGNGNEPNGMTLEADGTLHVAKIRIGGILLENNEGLRVNSNIRMHDAQIVMTTSSGNQPFIHLRNPIGGNGITVDGNGRIWVRSDKLHSGEPIQHW